MRISYNSNFHYGLLKACITNKDDISLGTLCGSKLSTRPHVLYLLKLSSLEDEFCPKCFKIYYDRINNPTNS